LVEEAWKGTLLPIVSLSNGCGRFLWRPVWSFDRLRMTNCCN
jgi:hypothetical protein